jgi:hypothetical protein
MRYVQSMYYRDWVLTYRTGQNIGGNQTLSINVPLYTKSTAPINGLSDIDHLDLYLYVITDVPLRFTYGSVSEDVTKSGVVKMVIPGSALPSGIVPYFGNLTYSYYMLPVSVTNLSSSSGRFAIPHYEALVDYQSVGTPNPYAHGTDPEPGGYVMPGDALWSTRFLYRGSRSAFPFLIVSQCIGQSIGRTKVAMMLPPVRNRGADAGGVGFLNLVWALNRLNRLLGIDGVIPGGV